MGRRPGEFGSNWWARRWLEVLESFGWRSRLQRGRSYARQGNVLQMEIGPGRVEARVQGSRPSPYKVRIQIEPLDAARWAKVIETMSGQAVFAARLLAEEMPPGLEEVFAAAGVDLFPSRAGDLTTSCSCPDWANPCKHIAAVYYLLGQEFDRDPFLLLRLRGRNREEIISALRSRWADGAGAAPEEPTGDQPQQHGGQPAGEPTEREVLPSEPQDFWAPGPVLEQVRPHLAPPEVDLALLKQLGQPSWWKGKPDFLSIMSEYYREVTRQTLQLAFRPSWEPPGDEP
ncbi:MAG: hypothetical protein D9V47_04790 [Clostridia bacterium]|nr:MAG: hypothetical protein D9V47_04790 [Clostridia bacterium]